MPSATICEQQQLDFRPKWADTLPAGLTPQSAAAEWRDAYFAAGKDFLCVYLPLLGHPDQALREEAKELIQREGERRMRAGTL